MQYPIPLNATRTQIRQLIRQRRGALSATEQRQAGLALLENIKQLTHIDNANTIAIYLSNDGEVDTQPTIEWLWQQGKQVVLPVLHPFSSGHLLFIHYTPHSPVCENKYGIIEPVLDQTQVCPIKYIDLIFTPLVAFDHHGQRLGMGGGYYDRTLKSWFENGKGAMPIGLAHDCQQVEQLPYEHWDIPLPIFVTPSRIWHWEKHDKSL